MTHVSQLVPVCVALAFASASASVAPTLTLEQQAEKAEVVVRGSLGTPQSVTEGSVTWRAYPLTVTEVVAGSTTDLPQLEGSAAVYVWPDAGDLPEWRTEKDAFFLLYTAKLDSPLVGFNQGYYAVTGNMVKVGENEVSVDDFRARVLTARGEVPAAETAMPETAAPEADEPQPEPRPDAPQTSEEGQ